MAQDSAKLSLLGVSSGNDSGGTRLVLLSRTSCLVGVDV